MRAMSDQEFNKLNEEYERSLPSWKKAEERLREHLEGVIARIENKSLVRAKIRSLRIKELESIRRKMERKGYRVGQGLQAGDLIGARVVCNNIEDVYRFYELLRETPGIDIIEVEDFIKAPQPSGYRALHINAAIEWTEGILHLVRVPCEIQIRTLIQDSWAELIHDDLYKNAQDLTIDLTERTEDLAALLATAEDIATRIRSRISSEVEVKGKVDLSAVTREGLAYLFSHTFGRAIKEYGIQQAMNACMDNAIAELDAVAKVVSDSDFLDTIRTAYREATRIQFDPDNEGLLVAAIDATAHGTDYAVRRIKKWGQREREEYESAWRRELLSDFPETVKEFNEMMRNGEFNEEEFKFVADALGALEHCERCGADILEAYKLSEAVYHYYDEDPNTDAILDFCNGISYPAHYEHSHLCPGCGESFVKLMNE